MLNCTILQTYGNSTTNTCQSCQPNCQSCIAGDVNGCTNCIANYFFDSVVVDDIDQQLPVGTNSSSCLVCPLNHVFFHQRKCLPCDPSCSTCSVPNDPTKCTGCSPPLLFSSSTNECLATCMSSQYQLLIGSIEYCLDCHPNCKTCFSGTSESCLSCFPDDPLITTELSFLKVD